jgi:hypothetical protein
VETPGEDVLRARLIVEDVKLERWRRSRYGNIISNSSVDRIAIVLELRDGVKNDRRLSFGDKRTLPFGVYAGSDSISIRRVEYAFYDFSIEFRRRLGEVQRAEFKPPPAPRLINGRRWTDAGANCSRNCRRTREHEHHRVMPDFAQIPSDRVGGNASPLPLQGVLAHGLTESLLAGFELSYGPLVLYR